MVKYQLLVLMLFVQLSGVYAQKLHYQYTENCQLAVSSLLQLDYKLSDSLLDVEKKQNPENVFGWYLDAYRYFIEAAISNSPKALKKNSAINDKVYNQLSNCSYSFPEKEYCKAHLKLMSAFINWKQESYLPAALDVKKSYELLSTNKKDFPSFIPNNIGLGMINFVAGSIPEEYQWVTKIFGVRGNNQGINDLWSAYQFGKDSAEYEYVSIEALFVLSYLNTLSQSNQNDISRVLTAYLNDTLLNTSEKSPLVLYLKALLLLKNGITDQAYSDLNTYMEKTKNVAIPQLYYLTGLVNLYHLNPSTLIYFSRYLSKDQNMNYLKSSRQKLAWYSLLNGDTANYWFHINKIPNAGKTVADADKLALKEAEQKEVPNIYLLKSRIYFDGGNYNKSLQTLIRKPPADFIFTKKESLEFTYRLGRIYQEKQMFEKSNSYFQITLDQGSNEPYYFAANSALQLAFYHEKNNNLQKARSYYEQCLSLDYDEYQNSISHKAKSGLKRIKK